MGDNGIGRRKKMQPTPLTNRLQHPSTCWIAGVPGRREGHKRRRHWAKKRAIEKEGGLVVSEISKDHPLKEPPTPRAIRPIRDRRAVFKAISPSAKLFW